MTSRRSRAEPQFDEDEEDGNDVLDIGTAVALATFEALLSQGMASDEAILEAWKVPVKFLQARQTWWEAVQAAYGEAGD